MKLDREKFLVAAIAIAAGVSGCGKLASKAEELVTQASPENSPTPSAVPTTGIVGDPSQVGAGAPTGDTATKSPTGVTKSRSSLAPATTKGSTLSSPTKELGVAPPTKEVGLAPPAKEIGPPAKTIAPPTKEIGAKKLPSPVKEY
jgi:hypothetical protein